MFDRPDVFYFNNPKTIFDDQWLLDQEKISALKQHNFVIADFSSEHYGTDGLSEVYQALENSGINFILLNHDPGDHLSLPRMFFYPYWYHYGRKNFEKIDVAQPRKYKLGCLNLNPRPHRIANYLALQNNKFLPDIKITMHENAQSFWRDDDVTLSDHEINEWQRIRNSLPIMKFFPNSISKSNDATIKLSGLEDCYFHLVTETTVIPRVFMSEKIWKPVAGGNLFLVFGNPGSIKYLRDQGVDVFDDIIDHSYDNEIDWRRRLEQIHQVIDNLLEKDINAIFQTTLDRRRRNQDLFFAGDFGAGFSTTISEFLDTHVPIC